MNSTWRPLEPPTDGREEHSSEGESDISAGTSADENENELDEDGLDPGPFHIAAAQLSVCDSCGLW